MASDLKRLVIGHVGCHAALPGLDAARLYVSVERRPAVVLCLELPSLHIQPPSGTLDDAVVHALFSDAASVVVIEPTGTTVPGLEVLDVASVTDVTSAEHMTWNVTDLGFKMTLSRHVPDVLAGAVGPLVDAMLARSGLGRADVGGWVVHPGGPRVLDVIGGGLGLSDLALSHSRKVLAEHGNCSSATVLVALEAMWAELTAARCRYVVALAFGPGLTLAGALLRPVDVHS
jgi:predicted naringenin-chalcone synthase